LIVACKFHAVLQIFKFTHDTSLIEERERYVPSMENA
jgi:hypothetical protein